MTKVYEIIKYSKFQWKSQITTVRM